MGDFEGHVRVVLGEWLRSFTLVGFDDSGNEVQIHHPPTALDDIALRALYREWQEQADVDEAVIEDDDEDCP